MIHFSLQIIKRFKSLFITFICNLSLPLSLPLKSTCEGKQTVAPVFYLEAHPEPGSQKKGPMQNKTELKRERLQLRGAEVAGTCGVMFQRGGYVGAKLHKSG